MRIGVISDTHIPTITPEIPKAILEDFKEVDMVIHAGDLVDLSVLDKLRKSCKDVRVVCGNMDPYEVQAKLPKKLLIKTAKHKIGVMHGFGPPANLIGLLKEEFKGEGCDLIIFGHSHCASSENKEGVMYFNPGSPVDKTFCEYNSYGIIEINGAIEAKIIKL